jgi:hypothetical protein
MKTVVVALDWIGRERSVRRISPFALRFRNRRVRWTREGEGRTVGSIEGVGGRRVDTVV